MKLLIGLTKIWRLLFKKDKAPKATNEMKPIEMGRCDEGIDLCNKILDVPIKVLIDYEHWRVTKKWHKSPTKYFIWINKTGNIELRRYNTSIYTEEKLIGRLSTLYKQYYGQKDNN